MCPLHSTTQWRKYMHWGCLQWRMSPSLILRPPPRSFGCKIKSGRRPGNEARFSACTLGINCSTSPIGSTLRTSFGSATSFLLYINELANGYFSGDCLCRHFFLFCMNACVDQKRSLQPLFFGEVPWTSDSWRTSIKAETADSLLSTGNRDVSL